MPRPRKCRKVCKMPISNIFRSDSGKEEVVVLAVDEYECIRLVDYMGFSQERCAEYMQVSRATAQLICDTARKKIASALVNGCTLIIDGGDYRLCDGEEEYCGCGGCEKHNLSKYNMNTKGDITMRIAVTYENEEIFQHFGHTSQFKVYDVEDGKIISEKVVDTNGEGHGALANVLKELQADVLICGGIGGGAQTALANAGVKLFGGVKGSCDDAANAYLEGNLEYNPNVKCNHHGEGHTCGSHHHGESHTCGSHACGGHKS